MGYVVIANNHAIAHHDMVIRAALTYDDAYMILQKHYSFRFVNLHVLGMGSQHEQ